MGLTANDLTDVIAGFLLVDKKPTELNPRTAKKNTDKRIFLSDYELRKMIIQGEKILRVPSNAIISPLSLDWIDFNGIEIIYGD
ncbi:MAG: hypothetical protein L6420_08665 [Elusimicrobia bacterium]|nr:hypothetical protein [Elusimicrobiota bacterium]